MIPFLAGVLSKEKTTFFVIFSYVENIKDYNILFSISLTYCAILFWDFLELCCIMQQCRLCRCLQKQSNAERYIFLLQRTLWSGKSQKYNICVLFPFYDAFHPLCVSYKVSNKHENLRKHTLRLVTPADLRPSYPLLTSAHLGLRLVWLLLTSNPEASWPLPLLTSVGG